MTDARTERLADGEPIEPGCGAETSAESLPHVPDPGREASVAGDSGPVEGVSPDRTVNVAGDPAQADDPAACAGHDAGLGERSHVDDGADAQTHACVLAGASADRAPDPVPTDPAPPEPVPNETVAPGPLPHDAASPDPDLPGPVAADPAADRATPAPALRDPDEAALRLAEAVVFASATPMTPRALSQILPDDMDAAAVIAALQARYQGRGLELCDIGGGLQFRTAADLAPQLRKVVQVPRRLPRVALETLAIVAYHQPITRPEIEDLRGTGLSQQTLDVLLENDLIVSRGRKETPGRPTLWGTTAKFLEYFGLRDIRELPRRQDLLLEAVRPETDAEARSVPPEDAQPQPAYHPPPAAPIAT